MGGDVYHANDPHEPMASGEVGASTGWGIGALLLVLAGWVGFLWFTGIRLEDALVTYRYAENLALGEGLVFNPGEKVLGLASPVLTLLLGLGGLVLGIEHIPLISSVLGITAGAIGALAVFALLCATGVGPRWSALTIIVLGLHPLMLWTTTGGMESPLVLCFMATSLLAVVRERWTSALVLAALLTLTRLDGGIWGLLIALTAVARAGKRSIGPILVYAAFVGAWVIFATLYYDSPVPHGLIARRTLEIAYSSHRGWLLELHGYAHWFVSNLWLPHTYGFARHQVWGWLVCMVLGVLGIARRSPKLQTMIVPAAFIPAIFVVFYLGHAPTFPWYAAPITWCAVLLGMTGLWELWVLFDLYFQRFALPRWVMTAGSLVIVGVIAASLVNRGMVTYRQQRDQQKCEEQLRQVVGQWLGQHAQPGESIATEAIGYQGFYSKRRIVDLAGRISPEVVEIMRCSRSSAEAFHKILSELEPKYLVLRSFEVRENRHFHGGPLFASPAEEAYFLKNYAAVKECVAPMPSAADLGENAELTIYRRREMPVPVGDPPAVPPQT